MRATTPVRAGVAAGAVLAFAILALPVGAEPVALTVTSGPSLQQIENRPCIIGDPSCHNPEAFPYTLIAPQDAEGTLTSPTYTVDQIRDIVGGNSFFVGLDLNQAMGINSGAYNLESFSLSIDGVLWYSTSAPQQLVPSNPGNGFSDASIGYFDLTNLTGTEKLVFTATFSGATAGREQFFLASVNGGNAAHAPEPATMILLGSGLAGVAALKRYRSAKASR